MTRPLTKEALFALRVVVPEPILVMALSAPNPAPLTLMAPAPARSRFCAPVMEPVRESVAPASAPMVVTPASVTVPVTTLVVPLASACKAPPLLMPEPFKDRASPPMLTPFSCSAAPLPVTTVLPVTVPRAEALETFTAPEPMVSTPFQVLLALLSSSVPLSFFRSALETEVRPKAVFRVSVFPAVTSMALLAWFKVMTRLVAKVPVARRPTPVAAFTLRITPLAPLPSAAFVETATTPP